MEELQFSNGTIEVVVLPEVGARIHRLRAFGHDVLRTPRDPHEHVRDPFFWGAYVMAPWCNRVATGALTIGSRRLVLASNFVDGSALHGQTYARPWELVADGTLRIVGGGDGWPWAYEASLRVDIIGLSVRMEMGLTNQSSDPMPAGLGIHPWFRRPLLVAVRGDAVYPANAATPPQSEPVRGAFDLREIGAVGADLDATWTDLADPPVELCWPTLGVRATMRVGPPPVFIVVASPGHLDAIAVEPQTHAPQGIRRLLNGEPGSLVMLDPGRTLSLGVEVTFERFEVGAG